MSRDDRAGGWSTALAVVVLVLGASACGSDNDGNDNASAETKSQDRGQSGSGTSAASGAPEQQIKAVYDKYFAARYATKQYEQACAMFSISMRKEYPMQSGIGKSCVQSMRLEDQSRTRDPQRARVVKVEMINNRVATGYVRDTTPGHPSIPLRFVSQGGAWKLDGNAREN